MEISDILASICQEKNCAGGYPLSDHLLAVADQLIQDYSVYYQCVKVWTLSHKVEVCRVCSAVEGPGPGEPGQAPVAVHLQVCLVQLHCQVNRALVCPGVRRVIHQRLYRGSI